MAQRKGGRKVTRGTATSTPDLSGLHKLEASPEAKAHEPSDVDAMGKDKRRAVVGHSYGPSRKSQVIFFIAVAALVVFVVGGSLAAIAAFDQPPDDNPDAAPWAQTPTDAENAAEQAAAPANPSGPCGEPGNVYPVPAGSPCAPEAVKAESPSVGGDDQPIAGTE